jgi:hypothetical protein
MTCRFQPIGQPLSNCNMVTMCQLIVNWFEVLTAVRLKRYGFVGCAATVRLGRWSVACLLSASETSAPLPDHTASVPLSRDRKMYFA